QRGVAVRPVVHGPLGGQPVHVRGAGGVIAVGAEGLRGHLVRLDQDDVRSGRCHDSLLLVSVPPSPAAVSSGSVGSEPALSASAPPVSAPPSSASSGSQPSAQVSVLKS